MSFPYSNFDAGGESDLLNISGTNNNILVKNGSTATTSTFLTNNEVRESIDFANGINIVGLGHGTSLQVENNEVRIGNGGSATGTSAISIGESAGATSTSSISIGSNSTSSGIGSISLGEGSAATNTNTISIGTGATAQGERSITIGSGQNTTGTVDSIAIGTGISNTSNVQKAITIGKDATCKANNGICFGESALVETTGYDSVVMGRLSSSLGGNGIVMGLGSSIKSAANNNTLLGGGSNIKANTEYSILLGTISSIETNLTKCILLGYNSLASANNSICIGENARTNSSGVNGICIGKNSVGNSSEAIAIGTGARASGTDAIGMGEGAQSTGIESIVIGKDANVTTSRGAICIGARAIMTNGSSRSIAIGEESDVTGPGAIAFGNIARANSTNAFAIGTSSTASGNNTLSMGTSSSATQQFSTAIGAFSSASAQFSIALGQGDVGIGGTNGIAIGVGADVDHADTIVISTNQSVTTSTRTGLFIDPVSEKTPDTNFNNVHYDTSTKEMYRSPYQLGTLITRDITVSTTLTNDDLVGKVIRITSTGSITVTLPDAFSGANCIIINGSNHNHTLTKVAGNTLNYNQSSLSLQTSKRVHHVYGFEVITQLVTARDWYVD